MITVVLADDHIIFRQGLIKLLQSADDISVTGEAGDGNEILKVILREKPDVALLDITMSGLDGFEVFEQIKKNSLSTKVIFLTMHNDPLTARKALMSKASGYVIKDNAFEDLLYAIRAVSAGGKFISPSISDKILNAAPLAGASRNVLTEREREILTLIASGLTNKKIADQLSISIKTVETHRTRILQKLDIHSTADLVKYAIRTGLLT
jgi:DNA-binding NarL/FixJ family response regulator